MVRLSSLGVQEPPLCSEVPDVSAAWLRSSCGNFSCLDRIWKDLSPVQLLTSLVNSGSLSPAELVEQAAWDCCSSGRFSLHTAALELSWPSSSSSPPWREAFPPGHLAGPLWKSSNGSRLYFDRASVEYVRSKTADFQMKRWSVWLQTGGAPMVTWPLNKQLGVHIRSSEMNSAAGGDESPTQKRLIIFI